MKKRLMALILIFILVMPTQIGLASDNQTLEILELGLRKLFHSQGQRLSKEQEAEKIPILLYHHILAEKDIKAYSRANDATLSLENFQQQMDFLERNGYKTISSYELEEFVAGRLRLDKKSVLIHFDDGYLSNTALAYPILKEKNMQASIFIMGATEKIPYQEFNPQALQFINFQDMDEFRDVFSFESHTYDLHRLVDGKVRLSLVGKEELRRDFLKNKELLAAKRLAYPRGKNTPLIRSLVKETGHQSAYTVRPDYVRRGMDPYALPRFSIFPSTSMEEFKNILEGNI